MATPPLISGLSQHDQYIAEHHHDDFATAARPDLGAVGLVGVRRLKISQPSIYISAQLFGGGPETATHIDRFSALGPARLVDIA